MPFSSPTVFGRNRGSVFLSLPSGHVNLPSSYSICLIASQAHECHQKLQSFAKAIMSSARFVVAALDAIEKLAGTQTNPLATAIRNAKVAVKDAEPQLPDPEIIFLPLQLATRSRNVQLTNTALDCIGKLTSSSYFSATSDAPTEPPPTPSTEGADDAAAPAPPPRRKAPLIERAIDTICDCFQGETTRSKFSCRSSNRY